MNKVSVLVHGSVFAVTTSRKEVLEMMRHADRIVDLPMVHGGQMLTVRTDRIDGIMWSEEAA